MVKTYVKFLEERNTVHLRVGDHHVFLRHVVSYDTPLLSVSLTKYENGEYVKIGTGFLTKQGYEYLIGKLIDITEEPKKE